VQVYEQVAVSDVAREAEVSEQTVYNYFQTKDQLRAASPAEPNMRRS